MKLSQAFGPVRMCRRQFICRCGCAAAGAALARRGVLGTAAAAEPVSQPAGPAVVRGTFLYPATETLKKAGYYSWPGSTFNAEGRQKEYMAKIADLAQRLGMQITMERQPLHDPAGVARFISEVKDSGPDGLLLIPFYKADWKNVCDIVKDTGISAVILANLGVLLSDHINRLKSAPGVYLISSLDDFGAVEYGMRMIRTRRRMQQACLLSIGGTVASESTVECLGTRVRVLPSARFGDEFKRTPIADEVKEVAARFRKEARKIVEPSDTDVVDAARASVALKKVVTDEKADALMMDCLGGIQKRLFPPPCMGYMRLRDEGIPAGCQNELGPALTMMLVQHLFDKPGFQQNPAFDTERNLYYGSHCTSPTRLEGAKGDSQPYILRSHAEAGIGTVPEVIWPVGRDVTMAAYHPGKKPTMILYTGKVTGRCDTPPAGGCRSNLTMTINELADVTAAKGTHQTIFAGNHARQLKAFCQLYGISVVV